MENTRQPPALCGKREGIRYQYEWIENRNLVSDASQAGYGSDDEHNEGLGAGDSGFYRKAFDCAADSFYCKQDCEDYQPYYE